MYSISLFLFEKIDLNKDARNKYYDNKIQLII